MQCVNIGVDHFTATARGRSHCRSHELQHNSGRGDDAVTPTSRDKGALSVSFSLLSVLKWKSALKHELYMSLLSFEALRQDLNIGSGYGQTFFTDFKPM